MSGVEDIPRAITYSISDGSTPPIPEGFPVLSILDQSKLPYEEDFVFITDWREVIDAIKKLKVRGAPAIGIAGAAALSLRAAEFCYAAENASRNSESDFDRVFIIDKDSFDKDLYLQSMDYSAQMIANARPTAVSLARFVEMGMQIVREELETGSDAQTITERLSELVFRLIDEDENANKKMGMLGSSLLKGKSSVLTHCNAGSLATSFFGTALGVVYEAYSNGKIERVYADETRPVNQGARLTVWELSRAGVPVTLLCDDMAASLMQAGKVDAVFVGADRIAANGDVANKIGTLGVAVLAKHFDIPFYVVAPVSTIDFTLEDGAGIPIEQRDETEVLPCAIEGVDVINPAFDVTPAYLVTKIVTECGVFSPEDLGALKVGTFCGTE